MTLSLMAGCSDNVSPTNGNIQDGNIESDAGVPNETREINHEKDASFNQILDADRSPVRDAQVCRPGVEVCNGTDDDYDGTIDEADSIIGDGCELGLPGACNFGQLTCRGGEQVCQQTIEPSDEVCDEADNDYDGATDENSDGPPLRNR